MWPRQREEPGWAVPAPFSHAKVVVHPGVTVPRAVGGGQTAEAARTDCWKRCVKGRGEGRAGGCGSRESWGQDHRHILPANTCEGGGIKGQVGLQGRALLIKQELLGHGRGWTSELRGTAGPGTRGRGEVSV